MRVQMAMERERMQHDFVRIEREQREMMVAMERERQELIARARR